MTDKVPKIRAGCLMRAIRKNLALHSKIDAFETINLSNSIWVPLGSIVFVLECRTADPKKTMMEEAIDPGSFLEARGLYKHLPTVKASDECILTMLFEEKIVIASSVNYEIIQ